MSKEFAKMIAALGASDESADVRVWVDTGFIPLNFAIGGSYERGMPSARIVEIYGPESSGKTWIASECMKAAQLAGGFAGFHDHERSFKLSLAKGNGLDDSPERWLYRKPKSYEDSIVGFIKAVRAIRENKEIPASAPIVWVFDSLASMVPKQLLDKDADAIKMNDNLALAKLTSTTFPAIAQVADDYNVLVIFLNQIRTAPGVMYGDPTTTPGGKAPKFYASVRIQLGATRLTKGEGADRVMIGSEVTARCIKNKVNRPFLTAKWRFTFREDGSGFFDVIGSLVDFAVDKGLIAKAGPRLVWTDGKQYFRNALVEHITAAGLKGELEDLIKRSGVEPDEELVPEEEAA